MFPADHLAGTNEEDLYHRILAICRHSHDVLVLAVGVSDLLRLHTGLYAFQKIPIGRRALKLQCLGSRLHFFGQFFDHRAIISIQKRDGRIYVFFVLLFGDRSRANAGALSHMVVEAGTFLLKTLRKLLIAGAQMVEFIDQIDGIPHRARTGKGSEVFGFVFV